MTQRRTFLIVAVAVLGLGIAIWLLTQSSHAPESTTTAAGPKSAGPGAPSAAPASVANGSALKFSSLSPIERSAFMAEMRERDPALIFQAMLDAGRIDLDRRKQLSIQAVLAYALRTKAPEAGLLDQMHKIISDASHPNSERAVVLGVLIAAQTRGTTEILLQLAGSLTDKTLRKMAISGVRTISSSWGDGTFHEEMSHPLEQAWRESQEQELLISVAVAMAQVGAANGIGLLLDSALREQGRDDVRARAACGALGYATILNPNAVPPLSAILASQPPGSISSQLASDTLARIPIPAAAKALVNWLQNDEGNAAPLAREYVIQSTSPAQLAAWEAALDPSVPFRSEKNRDAIRAGLAEYRKNRGG